MITRLLLGKERTFYQHDTRSVDTQFGRIEANAINAASDGAVVESNTHEKFIVLTPTWLDRYKKLERGPQLMLLKDLGYIAAETGIGQDSIVGDAGTGTGAAAIYFARIAKHVYTYDVRVDHVELGKRNAQTLGVENITIKEHDVYTGIPDEGFDVFVLDNPEPWNALPFYTSVKIGGWIVSYTPTVVQAAQFVDKLPIQMRYSKTVELIAREWHSQGVRVRPSSDGIGHTGFLVFARRVQ